MMWCRVQVWRDIIGFESIRNGLYQGLYSYKKLSNVLFQTYKGMQLQELGKKSFKHNKIKKDQISNKIYIFNIKSDEM